MTLPNLSPTTLAQYIRLENCDRFLRFRLVPEDAERLQRRGKLAIQSLTLLVREAGAEFESDIAASWRVAALFQISLKNPDQVELDADREGGLDV